MQNILALQSLDIETTDSLNEVAFISTVSILCCVVGTERHPYYTAAIDIRN